MKRMIPYVAEGSEVKAPTRGTEGAAGWDVYAAEDAVLKPFQAVMIATGVRAAIPEGHCLLLMPRSGLSFKQQILQPNSVGLIDEDYRGPMKLTAIWMPEPLSVIELYETFGHPPESYCRDNGHERTHHRLRYRKDAVFEIKRHDRITQALLIEYVEQDWSKCNALPATLRGGDGFGSTGVRAPDAGTVRGGP